MVRGILTGVIWGAIVGFGILTLANELAPPVNLTPAPVPTVSDATPAAPELRTDETPETTADVTPDMPSAEPDRSGAQTEMQAPEAETDATPEVSEEVAGAPEIAQPDALDAPEGENMGEVVTPESSQIVPPPLAMEPEADVAESLPLAEENLPDSPALPEGVETAPEASEAPEEMALDGAEMKAVPEATLEEGPEVEAMPGQKVGSFTDRADNRVSSRLPSISSAVPAEEETPTVVAEDLPALLAYSANYTDTPPGPVMSVILMDIGDLGPEDTQVTSLPFPVTFAVDALGTRAGDRAMAYRNQGLEVMAMVGLPDGATPQDAAVTLSRAMDLVPVSIGFLDVPSGSFQTSRQVAAQVVATAQESGRGLVSFPRGLNAMEQEADRAKAPAALVFRDLDGQGQDVDAIKRFLDQAAFQAGTGKTVVLLGRSRAETLQALAEWSLGNRAATVTMVPLSYLLSRTPL